MPLTPRQQLKLRELPAVDQLLDTLKSDLRFEAVPKSVLLSSIRKTIESLRQLILAESSDPADISWDNGAIIETVYRHVIQAETLNLQRTVNATGVVVHTNLGRSLLSDAAVDHIQAVASCYSNLEFDLSAGRRGSRYSVVEPLLCEITGAEAAMVVNNNAGAVLLCLDTIAKGKSVVVSRGELVEIGGAFRIPDVMVRSGACLKEVGTTNRTHLRDYEAAIDTTTGLLLKVHTSNYSIVGFTASVSLDELVQLGSRHHLPVMEDLGSGSLIDLSKYGMIKEPMAQASVAAGVDLVTFSGDKLLGGPQAGIILGRRQIMERIKKNPLTRALRIDKLTLAALESTLRLYRDETRAVEQIPTLRMLTTPLTELENRARQLAERLAAIDERLLVTVSGITSRAGGGSLPLLKLPSKGIKLRIAEVSANALEKALRFHRPPIIVRIEADNVIIDLRTVQEDEPDLIVNAVESTLTHLQQ
jgi:L-seryl-tRNA(Ser) seleniumtransferase